jgi:putative transposase
MSRYRLLPTPAQEAVLRSRCAHARYIWNLSVEQHAHWRPGRTPAPGYLEQCRQLTSARAEHDWLRAGSRKRMVRLKRKLARAKRGSNRRARIKLAVARLKVRETDRRKDWAEPGRNVRQKADLNRGILVSGWGLLARRLQDKAPGRVEKISPAFTSQRCSACGHIAAESRKSQALFACVACSFACNADVNAARNIAAGHAVTARGGDGTARPVNREPQLLLLPA